MPEKSTDTPRFDLNQARFTQISESHCGPATVQMLLSVLGQEVSQEAVAQMGGAADLIELNGMRVDQLATAVRKLAPQAQFWYKDHATLEELVALVAEYGYPVGVEWQGLFEDEDDEDDDDEDDETGDDDYGHYSVVTHVNPKTRQLVIADPYKTFISQARVFTFDEFDERWYDYNEVINPRNGRTRLVKDDHMLFIITPMEEIFPLKLGMRRDIDEMLG